MTGGPTRGRRHWHHHLNTTDPWLHGRKEVRDPVACRSASKNPGYRDPTPSGPTRCGVESVDSPGNRRGDVPESNQFVCPVENSLFVTERGVVPNSGPSVKGVGSVTVDVGRRDFTLTSVFSCLWCPLWPRDWVVDAVVVLRFVWRVVFRRGSPVLEE